LTKDGGIEVVEASYVDADATMPPFKIFNSIRDRCKLKIEAYADAIGIN